MFLANRYTHVRPRGRQEELHHVWHIRVGPHVVHAGTWAPGRKKLTLQRLLAAFHCMASGGAGIGGCSIGCGGCCMAGIGATAGVLGVMLGDDSTC